MTTVLYISAYQYSGSTLTSFLLNTHPDITSLGHTTGWPFGADEEFFCSCGQIIQECKFYTHLADTFRANKLPFEFQNFGVDFKLAQHPRINRYLTASLPFVESSRAEQWRDALFEHLPVIGKKIRIQEMANKLLIDTALEFHKSKIYLDNSLSPFRLRNLEKIDGLTVKNIHLIRNPRGVAASCLRHRGWAPELAIELWLRQQRDIVRVASSMPGNITIHYDSICTDTDETLATLHRFAGVAPRRFSGDFKDAEHHILGNQMRMGDGKIRLDTRWKDELSAPQLTQINDLLLKFLSNSKNKQYRSIIEPYLD